MKKLSLLKFVLSVALSVSLLVSIPVTTFAQSYPGADQAQDVNVIDLNNLGDNVILKKVSYDEAIADIAKTQGISVEKAKRLHPDKSSRILSKSGASIASNTNLYSLELEQNVSTFYKPKLKIYVFIYSEGSFRQFTEMFSVQLDRYSVLAGSQQFAGSIEAKIHYNNATKLTWIINGDFFDNGTTTISGSVTANGLIWSGTGTVEYSSNHFKYWFNSNTYSLY